MLIERIEENLVLYLDERACDMNDSILMTRTNGLLQVRVPYCTVSWVIAGVGQFGRYFCIPNSNCVLKAISFTSACGCASQYF